MELPEIPEFYAGKSVFITGSTGFIGKVLLWKLLHSCPKIKKIYILLRPKRGNTIEERKELLLQSPIFNNFKSDNQNVLEKVEAMAGDIAENNLGLSDFNMQLLRNEVSIVFFSAALLKMVAPLKEAVNVNTKGLLRALDIALEMKQLLTFIYVSTAYCCSEVKNVEEKLYSMSANPYHIMHVIDWIPQPILDKITLDIIEPLPNTYTFSKRLAELVLSEYQNKLSLVVARPTIVVASWKEPMPGWVDSLVGAVGLAVAVGTGLLHSAYTGPENKGDMIPVDFVCNRLIAIPWAENKTKKLSSEIRVYNLALIGREQVTWNEYIQWCKTACLKYPFKNMLWYPSFYCLQSNLLKHKIRVLLYQLVPAYVIDFLLKLCNQKTFLVKVQKKITQGESLLSYFASGSWNFETKNVMQMKQMMNEADKSIFELTEEDMDEQLLSENAIISIKKYIFHEKFNDPTEHQLKMKLFFALKIFVQLVLYYFIFKLLLLLVETVRNSWIQ